jgi:hypothetical protein
VSSSSILPGGNGSSGGISDVVSQDDLSRFAQIAGVLRYLTAPLDPPPPPTSPLPIATGVLSNVYTNFAAASLQAGLPQSQSITISAWWAHLLAQVGDVVAFIIQMVALLITPLAQVVLEGLGDLRKGIDPAVGILAQEVLTEFLGVEVGVENLPLGIGGGDHLARAQAIGALMYNQLEKEFITGGQVVPSSAPAQTFSGLAINFGLANGIMGLIGGMVPSFAGHYEELRELGEEVARNVGLGRLVRRALTPLITTLVSNPAQWAINIKYRATQFKEADLVNPFLGTQLPHDQLYNAMHLLGYSDDKIQAFIQMHEKKLSPTDVQLLIDWGFWTAEDGTKYVQRQGWPAGFAGNVLLLEGFRQVRPWITKEVDLLLSEVGSGQITVNEFAQVIDGFAISAPEKSVIVALANYRAQKSHVHAPAKLSGGELFYAFAAGVVTASDLTARWTAQGLPAADQDIRLQLWLLHLNRLHELEDERQKVFQAKLQTFQQKQAGAKKVLTPPIPPVPPFPLG